MRLPIGCEALDEVLGGGVECDTVTQFYGEAGAGKTNICMQLARNVTREGKKAIYIDTEGVSLERLRQIAGSDYETVLKNVLFFRPTDIQEQDDSVMKAVRLAESSTPVGLIVLDSAVVFYRLEMSCDNDIDERQLLTRELTYLLRLTRVREIPVVITNQIYMSTETGDVFPIGGHAVRHLVKASIRLDNMGEGYRRATVMKHRSIPEGRTAEFVLTGNGVECSQ